MELLDEFKSDILNKENHKLIEIVEDYLISRGNWFFTTHGKRGDEYKLKKEVEFIFNIDTTKIFIVGSSQLGFSITPTGKKYKFNHFRIDEENGKEESDVDVAIISEEIFESELRKLYDYLGAYHIKFLNEKFDGIARGNDKDMRKVYFQDYATYLLKGWLRADKMPIGYEFLDTTIDTQLNQLRKMYNRKINIAIYKSLEYLKIYHLKNIEKIKEFLIVEEGKECQ